MTHAVYPSLSGKTVVVTGGGSGIGETMVEGFARQKARVYFLDVAEAESKALVARLGNGVRFLACDLTNVDSLRSNFAEIEKQSGPVSVLVNNAANDDRHRFEEVTPAYWDQRLAVNLRHQFFARSEERRVGKEWGAGGS